MRTFHHRSVDGIILTDGAVLDTPDLAQQYPSVRGI